MPVLPGGDYGFAWNPNGTNARDLEHFINLFGYTAPEVLERRHQSWAESSWSIDDDLGLVKKGYLGRPAADRRRS